MSKIVFIMDPLETVKVEKDTTYFLMAAANELGHETLYCAPENLNLQQERLRAQVMEVTATDNADEPFDTGNLLTMELAEADAIFVRTDPPFDRRYQYVTLFLDRLSSSTEIINRPQALRDHNEKLAALNFAEYIPDTLISNDTREIVAFSRKHQRITLKPIDGFGGHGIRFIEYGQVDAAQIIKEVSRDSSHWIIAQQYLPEAREGDKRILLLDGDPLGAILRVHGEGSELNNLDQGGRAIAAELSNRDRQIIAQVGPWLVKNGVRFCGIDVIGDYLIEINVTSPTGLRQMAQFCGENLAVKVVERICGVAS